MRRRTLLWLPATLAAALGAGALYFAWPRAGAPAPSASPAASGAPAADAPTPGVEPPPRPGAAVLALLHLGSRVGRVEDHATPTADGGTRLERVVLLQVRRGEQRGALTRTLVAHTDAAGALVEASLTAPGLRTHARPADGGAGLALTVEAHGLATTYALPTPRAPLHVEATVFRWLARGGLREGRVETVSWLDLEHGRQDPVELRVGPRRDWHGLAGVEVQVRAAAGLTWTALVDEAGRVLRAESLVPGVSTRRWRPVDDSRGLHAVDLGAFGQVMASGGLPDGGRLRALRLGVLGVPAALAPAEVELRVPPLPEDAPPTAEAAAPWRAAAPFLEADAPALRERAAALAPPSTPPLAAARAIAAFVSGHVRQRDAVGPPSALVALRTGRGNCNELAALSVALLRAAGHGARLVFGVAHQAGAFRYHAWAEVLTAGGFVAFDPTLGQLPADATHLRLSAGGLEAQAAVLGATGRLTLRVLSAEEEP